MIAGQPASVMEPHYEENLFLASSGTFRKNRANGYVATGRHAIEPGKPAITITFADENLNHHGFLTCQFKGYPGGQAYLEQPKPGVLIESYVRSDGYVFVCH